MKREDANNKGLKTGDVFIEKHTFSQQDFDDFARLSGDDNPIHVDPDYAAKTPFRSTVAHGMLLYSVLCSALLKNIPGAIQLEHQMMFPTGTTAGETVSCRFEVLEFDNAANKARLKIQILRQNGELGLDGETLISLEDV